MILDRLFGLGGRRSSEDASSEATNRVHAADTDLRALEAGTAPKSPVTDSRAPGRNPTPESPRESSQPLASSPTNRGDFQDILRHVDIMFDQDNPGRARSMHDESEAARPLTPAPASVGTEKAAERRKMPSNGIELPSIDLDNRDGALQQDDQTLRVSSSLMDEMDEGIRFLPTPSRDRGHRRRPQASSVPSAYWQDFSPEGDLLQRAASAILTQGSTERQQRRARTLAAATDAARAEVIVLANSMIVDVVRAQSLVIEALRLPSDHPWHQRAAGEQILRRNPADILGQPPLSRGVGFVRDKFLHHMPDPMPLLPRPRWKPQESRGWVKHGSNANSNPGLMFADRGSAQSWIRTDPRKYAQHQYGGERNEPANEPHAEYTRVGGKVDRPVGSPPAQRTSAGSVASAQLYTRCTPTPMIMLDAAAEGAAGTSFNDLGHGHVEIDVPFRSESQNSIQSDHVVGLPTASLLSGNSIDVADMPYHPNSQRGIRPTSPLQFQPYHPGIYQVDLGADVVVSSRADAFGYDGAGGFPNRNPHPGPRTPKGRAHTRKRHANPARVQREAERYAIAAVQARAKLQRDPEEDWHMRQFSRELHEDYLGSVGRGGDADVSAELIGPIVVSGQADARARKGDGLPPAATTNHTKQHHQHTQLQPHLHSIRQHRQRRPPQPLMPSRHLESGGRDRDWDPFGSHDSASSHSTQGNPLSLVRRAGPDAPFAELGRTVGKTLAEEGLFSVHAEPP